MRVPSRRLPPLVVRAPSPLLKWGCLSLLMAVAIMLACVHPLGTAVFLAIAVPTLWLGTMADRRQRSRLLAKLHSTRPGNPLCQFARDFNCRAVDPWIIRATFEEVQHLYSGVSGYPIPLRRNDRWENLRIDGEDIDDIGCHVAQRAGYSMDDCRINPLYGKVKTVGDLVAFMTHQLCTRAI